MENDARVTALGHQHREHQQVLEPLEEASGARLELIVVENGLFGPRVTTAGLLPGKSIAETLAQNYDLRDAAARITAGRSISRMT